VVYTHQGVPQGVTVVYTQGVYKGGFKPVLASQCVYEEGLSLV